MWKKKADGFEPRYHIHPKDKKLLLFVVIDPFTKNADLIKEEIRRLLPNENEKFFKELKIQMIDIEQKVYVRFDCPLEEFKTMTIENNVIQYDKSDGSIKIYFNYDTEEQCKNFLKKLSDVTLGLYLKTSTTVTRRVKSNYQEVNLKNFMNSKLGGELIEKALSKPLTRKELSNLVKNVLSKVDVDCYYELYGEEDSFQTKVIEILLKNFEEANEFQEGGDLTKEELQNRHMGKDIKHNIVKSKEEIVKNKEENKDDPTEVKGKIGIWKFNAEADVKVGGKEQKKDYKREYREIGENHEKIDKDVFQVTRANFENAFTSVYKKTMAKIATYMIYRNAFPSLSTSIMCELAEEMKQNEIICESCNFQCISALNKCTKCPKKCCQECLKNCKQCLKLFCSNCLSYCQNCYEIICKDDKASTSHCSILFYLNENNLVLYNVSTGESKIIKEAIKISPILSPGTVLIRNAIYIVYGEAKGDKIISKTECITFETNLSTTSKSLKKMKFGKISTTLVAVNKNCFMSIGGAIGFDEDCEICECEMYDIKKDQWAEIKPLKSPRDGKIACNFNQEYIYTFGSSGKKSPCPIERLNIGNQKKDEGWEIINCTSFGGWKPFGCIGMATQVGSDDILLLDFKNMTHKYSVSSNKITSKEDRDFGSFMNQSTLIAFRSEVFLFSTEIIISIYSMKEGKWRKKHK